MTNNLYLDLNIVDDIPDAYRNDSRSIMQATGDNIGNLAFRHALRFLTDIDNFSPVNYRDVNTIIDNGNTPSSVIISSANWISTTQAYEASNGVRATTIERCDCPVTIFGLGAQASLSASEMTLGPNTERLARVISERSQVVSVRDELTRRVFEQIGIENTVITGCPSNMINPDPVLGQKVLYRAKQALSSDASWQDIRTHISEFSGGNRNSGDVLNQCLNLMQSNSAFYILQSPTLMPFLLGETTEISSAYLSNAPSTARTPNALSRILRSSLLHFSSISAWMDFARTCNLALGMRIHGNMVPLQAGVPSIVISHDSRTKGLAEFMGVPQVSAADFSESAARSPQQLFEIIAEKMHGYDHRRREIASIWRSYLQTNNLSEGATVSSLLDKS